MEGRSGDTVASSLLHAGPLACRIATDGSERGLFCGMGACGECAVVIDGTSGFLACMTPIEEGMAVEKQPPLSEVPNTTSGGIQNRDLSPSVLVVGGGPAGLSAAATIAEAGLDVVLIDERSTLGGQFYKQPAPGRELSDDHLDAQYRSGRALIARAEAAGVEILSGVTIWGAFSPMLLMATGKGSSWTLRPDRLVLATGARERAVPLPGWTLPGVIMTGAGQTLLRSTQVTPGRRVLVSGNGPLNLQVAAELAHAGVEVAALVERADLRWWRGLMPGVGMALAAPQLVRRGLAYRAALARRRVPFLVKSSVVEIHGEGRVESAAVASVDELGRRVPGTEREFAVDAVCLGYGFVPANEIPRALGCRHHVDERTQTLVTTRSESGRTSNENVWVVGDAGGVRGAYVAQALGEIAGHEIASEITSSHRIQPSRRNATRLLRRHQRFQESLAALYSAEPLTVQLAEPDTTICRCESVRLRDLEKSFSDGAISVGAVKRTTRAGMGNCQSRYCGSSILALAAEISGVESNEFSGFAPQSPVRPVEIGRIASCAHQGTEILENETRQESET